MTIIVFGLRARPSGTQEGSLVVNPTLRCACAGLLRVSASGTFQKHDTTNGIGQHRRAMAADQRGGKDRQSTVEG
ncbi:MAG: hypothetical protein IJR26_05030 [Bacteroidales bacterium]|nr:hypothetical protein [Bacteroidales bacterium]